MGTTLPWLSCTMTLCGVGSGALIAPVWLSPPFFAIWVGKPGSAVDVNVTGDPIKPVTEACTDWPPAVEPKVWVMTAIPFRSVLLVPEDTEPPPVVAAQWTTTFGTGAPSWSSAMTRYGVGSVASTVSVWPSPEFISAFRSCVAP